MITKDFTVAIVGGGMCGLACAIALTRSGIKVDVFEAAPKFEAVGAGVGLGPNAIRALQGLGILDAVLTKADEPRPTQRGFIFIAGKGNHELVHKYALNDNDLGLGIYRPDYLDALLPLIDPRITHFNMRCISVSHATSGKHILQFEDGTTHQADLIIGADGVKSITRNFVTGDHKAKHLIFTNNVAYRGIIPVDKLKRAGVTINLTSRPLCWVGLDKHIITFPIRGNHMLNVVAFATHQNGEETAAKSGAWVEQSSNEALLKEYTGWGSQAITLLEHMENPSKWSIHALNPTLESYVRENVVLVGDAAHAMLPHLGAGVGQGFEDVYALWRLLSLPQTKLSNLGDVLRVYNKIRPPRANMVLRRSKRMGEIYERFGDEFYTVEDMQHHLPGMWEAVWHHDLEAEVEMAIKSMLNRGRMYKL